MFDCDSEPTSYPFDSENECKFEYNKDEKELLFNCLKSLYDKENISLKVDKWTYDELSFIYENKKETFYRDKENLDGEEIEHILPLDKCYINGNDKMCLNSDGTFDYKVCNKKCNEYKGVLDHAGNSLLFYFESDSIKSDEFDAYVSTDNEITINNKKFKLEKE